ncbi:MAG: ABC transporter ATP-binding protein [Phycisphaerales bacterium]
MLPSRDSSKSRYRRYLDRRKTDPRWAQHRPDDPNPKIDRTKRTRSFIDLMKLFWQRTGQHKGAVLFALATLTITTITFLIIPASTKLAFDYILTDHPGPSGIPHEVLDALNIKPEALAQRIPLLWWLSGFVLVITLVAVTLGMLGRWQMTRVTKRLQVEFRRDAFQHAIQLPLHRVQHYKTGGMSSLLREDAGTAAELGFSIFYNPWRAVVQLTGTLIILAFTDWRMLVGGVALIPIVWITHKTWVGRIRPLYRDAKQARQNIDAGTTEAFGGLRVVRGFGRGRSESTRFVTGQHYMTRIEVLTWLWSRVIDVAWSILIPLASSAVLIYGGTQVVNGRLTLGDLMMFSTYLLMLLGPLETLTSTATNVQTNLAAFDRVLSLLEEPVEFADTKRGDRELVRDEVRGEIAIDDLSFAYPKSSHTGRDVGKAKGANSAQESDAGDSLIKDQVNTNPLVLHNISLHVQAGETIALVGPSGAGKTTLCNLIARFYDPKPPGGGRVLLDNVDLRDIDVTSYRSLLGIVEQDVFLFDGSIAENIAYARRDATEADIVAAATAAYAHDFISSMEQGYGTLIGERGVRLSGGQKQRLAIARAVLADPKILILDEATSNLDTESEQFIQQSLNELMRGRTCFVIAHRLSTIRHADRIVVLDKGRVIEVGSHDELLNKRGLYAHLLHLQVKGSEELTA